MAFPKVPVPFPNFVKYPLQTLLYILLAYFIYKEVTRGDECNDLRVAVEGKDKRIEKLEEKVDALTWGMAVKAGVIERLQARQDSTQINKK